MGVRGIARQTVSPATSPVIAGRQDVALLRCGWPLFSHLTLNIRLRLNTVIPPSENPAGIQLKPWKAENCESREL